MEKMNTDMGVNINMDEYVARLLAESKEHTVFGTTSWLYVVGILQTQLQWALGTEIQRQIVIEGIEERLNER